MLQAVLASSNNFSRRACFESQTCTTAMQAAVYYAIGEHQPLNARTSALCRGSALAAAVLSQTAGPASCRSSRGSELCKKTWYGTGHNGRSLCYLMAPKPSSSKRVQPLSVTHPIPGVVTSYAEWLQGEGFCSCTSTIAAYVAAQTKLDSALRTFCAPLCTELHDGHGTAADGNGACVLTPLESRSGIAGCTAKQAGQAVGTFCAKLCKDSDDGNSAAADGAGEGLLTPPGESQLHCRLYCRASWTSFLNMLCNTMQRPR